MPWPFKKENEMPNDADKKPDDKQPEKSPADLIAESLKPLTDSLAALRSEVAEMRKPPEKPPVKPEDPPSVLDDENAAFGARLTPLIARQFELEARIARDDVRREYESMGFGDLWKQYEKEINETLEATGLVVANARGEFTAQRGNPAYIRNVADMIIGRAARQGGLRHDSNSKKFFLEDANSAEGGHKGEPLETEGLTKKQIEAAQRFGISLKDYKKSVSNLEFTN